METPRPVPLYLRRQAVSSVLRHLFAVARLRDQRLGHSRGDPLTVLRGSSAPAPRPVPQGSPESRDTDGCPSAQLSPARYPSTPSSPLRWLSPSCSVGWGSSGWFVWNILSGHGKLKSLGGGGEGIDWWKAHLSRCTGAAASANKETVLEECQPGRTSAGWPGKVRWLGKTPA